jgi:hypothetical protein
MVVSKFQIGDEVETNEKYRLMAEDHNSIPGANKFETYIRAKVAKVKLQDIHRIEYNERGCGRMTPEVINQIVVITFENGNFLNQDFLQKVKE